LIASNHSLLLKKLKNIDIPFEPLHKIIGKPIEYISRQFGDTEYKKKYDKTLPYYTIISSIYKYKFYYKNDTEYLHPNIMSKLQGFQDNYFNNSMTQRDLCQMIANAVPTQVGFIIVYILLDKI
jgi:site-specific DNA-cytosine methylase